VLFLYIIDKIACRSSFWISFFSLRSEDRARIRHWHEYWSRNRLF